MSKPTKEQIANGVAIAVVTTNRIKRLENSSHSGYDSEEFDYRHVYQKVMEDLKNN